MTSKEVLAAIGRIRAAQTTDSDLVHIIAHVCKQAGCLDLGHLAREHPDVVLDLADELSSVSAQLADDPIVFEDLG